MCEGEIDKMACIVAAHIHAKAAFIKPRNPPLQEKAPSLYVAMEVPSYDMHANVKMAE